MDAATTIRCPDRRPFAVHDMLWDAVERRCGPLEYAYNPNLFFCSKFS